MRRLIRSEFLPEDDPFGRHIILLFGTLRQISRALQRDCPNYESSELNKQTVGVWLLYTLESGHDIDYICLVRSNTPPEVRAAVLAHETLHLVAYVFRFLGISLTESSEEAYCYYQQWLMERVYRAIRGR